MTDNKLYKIFCRYMATTRGPIVVYKTDDNKDVMFLAKNDVVLLEIENENMYIYPEFFYDIKDFFSLYDHECTKILTDWLIDKYPDLILPNKKLMESIDNGTRYVFFCWKPYWDMLSGYYNIYAIS